MRTGRVGGVPARDERLWGMLQAPRKGWGGARSAFYASWSQSLAAAPPPTIGSLSSEEGEGGEGDSASQNLALRRDSKRASAGGSAREMAVIKVAR